MPRALQKLTRNGNSTSITIPRAVLFALGWLPGQSVVIELLENKTLLVRLPNERDFGVQASPRVFYDAPAEVAP